MKTIVDYINEQRIVEIEQLKEWYQKEYGRYLPTYRIASMIKGNIFPIYSFSGRILVGYAVYDEVKNIKGITLVEKGIIANVKVMKTINRLTNGSFDKYKPFYRKDIRKLKVKPKKIKKEVIDGLYLNIMNLLWNKGKKKEITAKEAFDKLGGDRDKYSIYLGRLYDRGLVDRRKVKGSGGDEFIYWAKTSRGEYFRNLLKKWIGNDVNIEKLFRK